MKHTKTTTLCVLVLAVGALVFAIPGAIHGGSTGILYLSPSSGAHAVGTQFVVAVRLNSGSGAVNVAEGEIEFDPEKLQVVGVSKAGSVFSLWVQEPGFSNRDGIVTFAGGIPTPGFSGTGGRVLNITFRARSGTDGGTTRVAFVTGSILANDGQGTNVIGSLGAADFTLTNRQSVPIPTSEATPAPPATSLTRPVITKYPSQVRSHKAFDVGGTADPDVTVRIRAFRSSTPITRVLYNTAPNAVVETRANAAGQWLVNIPSLDRGVYRLEADAKDEQGTQSITSKPVLVRVGYAMLWWFWDALTGHDWWTILLWLLLLLAIICICWYGIRTVGRMQSAAPTHRRVKGPTDALMGMVQDMNDELALLDRISKSRPLYPEEKYLRSKLMQYRKKLKSELSP